MDKLLQKTEGGICAPLGFYANGVHCGLRQNKQKPDLALIYCDTLCDTAAVYTQNKVKGSPIIITQKHLANGKAQAIIVNSGNANTCNIDGEEKAEKMCKYAAIATGTTSDNVIVASTGIIGEVLPIAPIKAAMPILAKGLCREGNDKASEAILTTDLLKKQVAVTFDIDGVSCCIGGMAKGSGMIHPNMATMLCFLTSDVKIDNELLKKTLLDITDDTFNMVSVDGDTSTNDMAVLMCSGKAENTIISDKKSKGYKTFCVALKYVMETLSKKIAKDGEGATKLLTCNVYGAKDKKSAKIIAKSVATSSLFKCAMYGADPNWGRVLCAIGYADAPVDIDKVIVGLASTQGEVIVCENGRGVKFDEELAEAILKKDEINVNIILGDGKGTATAWGCDLTYEYIRINADYRT